MAKKSSSTTQLQLDLMATPVFSPRFLVMSLGNPGPSYKNTLHNAGHIVLGSLQSVLSSDPLHQQPSWTNERIGDKSCLQSINTPYHLVQSPTFMNSCGRWAAKTYRESLKNRVLSPGELSIVLVHDELEQELGVVKTVPWTRSPRGHNGVKDCHEFLKQGQFKGAENRWHRICVGIGRPQSRDADTVSDYVLSPLRQRSKQVLEDKAGLGVLAALKQLEAQWEKDFYKAQSKTQVEGKL